MTLTLHLLSEGEHEFAIDEYHRETGRRHFAQVGSTLHIGSGPMRVIETVSRDEDAGTLTVQVRYAEDDVYEYDSDDDMLWDEWG